MTQVPNEFLRFVRFAGAVLLLFLAWNLWKEIRVKTYKNSEAEANSAPSPWRGLVHGVMMIFLSPGPYLFWGLILGPLLVQALEISLMHAVAFLAGFYVLSIGVLQVIALILGRIGQLSERGRHILQFGSLALMLVIAVLLVASGLRG